MQNNQSSEITTNNETQNAIAKRGACAIAENESPETVLQTQPVSVINSDNNFALKKIAIFCTAGVLALSAFFIFSKETNICAGLICNHYSDPSATHLPPIESIGSDFVAYGVGATSLLVLTTLVGVPLLPAVAVSTGIWFLVQMIH